MVIIPTKAGCVDLLWHFIRIDGDLPEVGCYEELNLLCQYSPPDGGWNGEAELDYNDVIHFFPLPTTPDELCPNCVRALVRALGIPLKRKRKVHHD